MVMDNSKRKNKDFKERSMGFWEQVDKETNENEGLPSRRLLSPVHKKKILAERNVTPPPPFLAVETTTRTPKVQGIKPVLSSPGPCRSSSIAAAYDPVTNFTSPRPEFLRYNPNRLREILQRMEVGEGGSSSSSSDQAGNEEESASLIESSASPSDYEVDDIAMEEEEVEERPCRSRSRMVWKLLLIFGLFFISCHCLFPMTSPSITTNTFRRQEEEGNGGSEEITIPQRPTNWLYRDHLLTTHMGVSDVCLSSAGEMMCPVDGHTCTSSLVVADDKEEIHPIGSPAIGEEYLGVTIADLVMSDEVTAMVHSQVEDSSSHAQLGSDITLLAVEERVEYLSTSHAALFEREDDSQREECEQVMENFEAIERNNDIHLKIEKVEASPSSCPLNELLEETIHSTPARNAPQVVGQSSDEYKFSRIISLLAAVAAALVGLLSCFLFKYLVKPMPPPSLAPDLLPCSKSSIDEKETVASSAVEEESRDIDEDYRVDHLSLDRLREKYARRQRPTLQLLGEFSLAAAETTESEIGGGRQTVERIEPKGSEEPHSSTCQYEMRSSTRKSPSSSSNKLEGSYGPPAGKKLRKTEDGSSNKSEEKMVATTPLRRSDRLRKRVDFSSSSLERM